MTYTTKKLGEVCDVFTDGDWIESKDQSDAGIRLIQTGNIGEGVFLAKNGHARYVGEETFARLNCTEIFPGDLLISRLPDPIGRACIIPELSTRMITAVDCTIVRTDKKKLLSEFLLFYTNSTDYYDQLAKYLSGTTRTRISRGNLAKIKIPVPPIGEQRRIVEKIEKQFAKIDEAARLRAESLAATEQLLPAALHEIFSEGKQKGWGEKELGALCDVVIGGTPRRGVSTYWDNGILPWVSIADLTRNGREVNETKEKITSAGVKESNVKLLQKGTLLFSFKLSIGKVAFAGDDLYTNEAIAGLPIKDKRKLDKGYLFYFLRQFDFSGAQKAVKGATLNKAKINSLEVPLPPLAEQKEIVKKLDALSEKARALRALQLAQAADLKALKQSLLRQAFAG